LPAGTTDVAMTIRFRSGLALEIDPGRVIDRDRAVVLHDDVSPFSSIGPIRVAWSADRHNFGGLAAPIAKR
jgi:hypothetical protein